MSEQPNQSSAALKPAPRFKAVHVVINPASGANKPILNTLNDAFQEAEIDWTVWITKKSGDAQAMAHEAAQSGADVVAVYGGDGTVMEVANGLHGTGVPLAIFPGGTGNAMSLELGIPKNLAEAAALVTGGDAMIRPVDMGQIEDKLFFHLGLGIEGDMISKTDRESKDDSGILAYMFSIMRSMREVPKAHYRLTLDGHEQIEMDAINCMVTNFGSMGVAGLKLSHKIDVSDGLFDVILVREVDLKTFIGAAANAVTRGDVQGVLKHWQARRVTIEVEPPQPLTRDGETLQVSDLTVQIVPGAVDVIVPADKDQ